MVLIFQLRCVYTTYYTITYKFLPIQLLITCGSVARSYALVSFVAGNTPYIFIKQQPMCMKEPKATADYHE